MYSGIGCTHCASETWDIWPSIASTFTTTRVLVNPNTERSLNHSSRCHNADDSGYLGVVRNLLELGIWSIASAYEIRSSPQRLYVRRAYQNGNRKSRKIDLAFFPLLDRKVCFCWWFWGEQHRISFLEGPSNLSRPWRGVLC